MHILVCLFLQKLRKGFFRTFKKVRKHPQLHQYDLLQGILTDIVGILASAAHSLVVRATEKTDAWVLLIEIEPKLMSAISAIKKAREDAFLLVLVLGRSALGLFHKLLYLLPRVAVNDRLVYVLENRPILLWVLNSGFIAEGL